MVGDKIIGHHGCKVSSLLYSFDTLPAPKWELPHCGASMANITISIRMIIISVVVVVLIIIIILVVDIVLVIMIDIIITMKIIQIMLLLT